MSSKPPLLISFVCIAGFIGCFLTMILIISPPIQQQGRWFAIYLSMGTIFAILCLGGLWIMRKWAVVAYVLYAVLNQVVYWRMGLWNLGIWLFLQIFTVAIGIYYYQRMK